MVLTLTAVAVYGKVAAYVAGGFAAARAWFHKEIVAGRTHLAKELAVAKAEVSKVEGEAKAEVKSLL